jgi:hypothetical protein
LFGFVSILFVLLFVSFCAVRFNDHDDLIDFYLIALVDLDFINSSGNGRGDIRSCFICFYLNKRLIFRNLVAFGNKNAGKQACLYILSYIWYSNLFFHRCPFLSS